MIEISLEDLHRIEVALDYTRATIGRNPTRSTTKKGFVEIHGGRAYQSMAYLNSAIQTLCGITER